MMLRCLLSVAFIGIGMSVYPATIRSVSGGGNWNDSGTWTPRSIPGQNDDVIITVNGTVSVMGSSACRNLTVSPNAILQNGGSLGWVVLSIKGAIIDSGTIRNNPTANALWVEIYGDITNNGTWMPANTYIGSTKVQTITQASGTEFRGVFRRTNNGGYSDTFSLAAGSDLVLNLSSYDGMGYDTSLTSRYFWAPIDMANHNLTLKGGTTFARVDLRNCVTLNSLDSSSISDMVVRNAITLAGAATFTNTNITFSSRKIQTISQQSGTEFRGSFKRTNSDGYSDTFALAAASDLVLNLAGYDGMGYDTSLASRYFWAQLDMASHNLTIKGGTTFARIDLRNSATLTSQDSSTISDMVVRNDITLAGAATFTNTNVTFSGTTTVQGIMQNGGSLGWLTPVFNGTLVNNGTIRSNPNGNTLNLNLYGNIVNNGTWTPGTAYFASRKIQTISQNSGTEFRGSFKRTNSDGYSDTFALAAASALVLNLAAYDGMGYDTSLASRYFWAPLDMAHFNLTLRGGTTFARVNLRNSATLASQDSTSMSDISVRDSITLAGTTTLTNASVTFNGITTIADTLQNGGGLGWITIATPGGLYNRGVIRNNPKGNTLYITTGRDIVNNGTWKMGGITLVDTVNQTITLINGKPILSSVAFQAAWTSGPYQWKRADTNWGGNNRLLSFDSLTVAANGVYRCKKGDSLSRIFTVKFGGSAVRPPAVAAQQARCFSWRVLSGKNLQLSITSPSAGAYHVRLVALGGRVIAALDGTIAAGEHVIAWNRTIPQGAYVVQLGIGSKVYRKRVMFVK